MLRRSLAGNLFRPNHTSISPERNLKKVTALRRAGMG
jgi:hypothetical protein